MSTWGVGFAHNVKFHPGFAAGYKAWFPHANTSSYSGGLCPLFGLSPQGVL